MDFKTLLFEKATEAFKQYKDDAEEGVVSYTKWVTLDSLIDDAGLEDEYYEWKRKESTKL